MKSNLESLEEMRLRTLDRLDELLLQKAETTHMSTKIHMAISRQTAVLKILTAEIVRTLVPQEA